MPFERSTLAELISRNQADIESRLPGSDPRLRRSVVGALARVLSGAVYGLYGYLDWMALQVMPDTAEAEHLDRHAAIWLPNGRNKVAVAATGALDFTGADGVVVPAGTLLQRSDGAEYATDVDGTIASGTANIAVTASLAGADGNAVSGTTLTLVSPMVGIQSTATVDTNGLTGGLDTEDDDYLRARVLARIQQHPHGGAEFDYETWALEVTGITRAWVFPAYSGLGTVGIVIAADDLDPPIPTAPTVAEVQAYIDERRPVTADATVYAPTAVTLNFTIAVTPNTAAVKAAVEAELTDLLAREGEPGGTLLLSHIREAISSADGETDHTLTAPAADQTYTNTQIPAMGTITWA